MTDATTAFAFVSDSDDEWETMWGAIEEIHGDPFCQCPVTGETWQYMGSAERETESGLRVWYHQFRHRSLPAKHQRPIKELGGSPEPGDRVVCSISASPHWKPETARAVAR